MLSITSTWRQYFENPDEGLGTTYERFILHRHFAMIKEQYSVGNIVEIPSFGMTGVSGINSMWWVLNNVPVTVVDDMTERLELIRNVWNSVSLQADFVHYPVHKAPLPFADKSFDMSWNFASLWFIPDLAPFLGEMTRITKKVIFLCVPNRLGLGYASRLAFRRDRNGNLFLENIIPGRIKGIMQNLGWKVSKQGFLDIPPWPDIAMKKEDLLQKMGLNVLANKMRKDESNHICILDYYSGKNMKMENDIMKYALLENSPWIIKRFWAHHWYAIFSPH